MTKWNCVLELDAARRPVSGSEEDLFAAIRRGSDLRIYTEFLHNEHIDVASDDPERIREVAEFGITYFLDNHWVAGCMSLRQPVELPDGFGPRASMSFFLYNQNGQQAIARPFLDGPPASRPPGPAPADEFPNMPKYHQLDSWDAETNAPSSNFVYEFEVYRYFVNDAWREVVAIDAGGHVETGSLDALAEAFSRGCEVKAAIRGLCADLSEQPAEAIDHELYVQMGSCYYYTERKLFVAGSHPLIRITPAVPMQYHTGGWDFGWLVLRSDGHTVYRRCDPYTLRFQDIEASYAIRWFVRG